MAEPLIFDYRPQMRFWRVAGTAFFIWAFFDSLNKAMRTRAGETIYDSHGPVSQGFFWMMAGIGATLGVLGLISIVAALLPPRKLIITDTDITCPRGTFARNVTIPFATITEVERKTVTMKWSEMEYVLVRHPGRTLSIPETALEPGVIMLVGATLDEKMSQLPKRK